MIRGFSCNFPAQFLRKKVVQRLGKSRAEKRNFPAVEGYNRVIQKLNSKITVLLPESKKKRAFFGAGRVIQECPKSLPAQNLYKS